MARYTQRKLSDLASWSARVREFIGARKFDREIKPAIDSCVTGRNKRSAVGLSIAISSLCVDPWFNAQTGEWLNEEAHRLWVSGIQIRDGILEVSV